MTSAITCSFAFLIGAIEMTACSTNPGAPGPATGVCSDEPVAAAAEVEREPLALAEEPLAECGVAGAAPSER